MVNFVVEFEENILFCWWGKNDWIGAKINYTMNKITFFLNSVSAEQAE